MQLSEFKFRCEWSGTDFIRRHPRLLRTRRRRNHHVHHERRITRYKRATRKTQITSH